MMKMTHILNNQKHRLQTSSKTKSIGKAEAIKQIRSAQKLSNSPYENALEGASSNFCSTLVVLLKLVQNVNYREVNLKDRD